MADVIAKHICDLYKADVIAFVADVIAINFAISIVFGRCYCQDVLVLCNHQLFSFFNWLMLLPCGRWKAIVFDMLADVIAKWQME